ncbi:MAG: Glu/Leu/Phe/Val dehydrogenase dimerization domain-containing protein [Ktedonobacteraceae bacterium]
MENSIFELMEEYDYENIFFCQDKTLGLKAIIVIHNTTLGPAAGGCRMWPYATEAEAIKDALRLARGMTYKNAAAGLPYGGGKCVIIGDPKRDKNEGLLRLLGRFINRLDGLFLTGVDVGTTIQDMDIMRLESPHVVTVSEALGGPGDSGFATAFGVFQGIRACLKEVYGSPLPQGRTVAVQGVGAVGKELVKQLVETGAIVSIADVDQERAQQVAAQYNVKVVEPENIHRLDVDVYSPCALGSVVNDQTIPELHCKIICGCANNQLAEERHGDLLTQQGILYAPDYIVNAGGVVYNVESLSPGGFNRQHALERVAHIYRTMGNVIALAKEQNIATYRAADTLVEQRIALVGKVKNLAV